MGKMVAAAPTSSLADGLPDKRWASTGASSTNRNGARSNQGGPFDLRRIEGAAWRG